MRDKGKAAGALAWLALLAGMTGCAAQALRVEGGEAVLPEDEGSPAFLDRLASQPGASENDAFRGILLLLDGQDKAKAFRQRVESLAGRGIIAAGWPHDATRALTKGKLAYMICQACKIRGGVVLRLTGPSQWYCLRELQYRQMMSLGAAFTQVTGMEFVAVLGRADVYMRTGRIPGIMEVTGGG